MRWQQNRTGAFDIVREFRATGRGCQGGAGCRRTVLHVDVMDGHFVPNITIGPPVVKSLRKALPDAIFDCHLMIENPDELIPAFAEAGATWISCTRKLACIWIARCT